MSTLLAASNGKLYGTTRQGGSSARGLYMNTILQQVYLQIK